MSVRPLEKKMAAALGSRMAYHERGSGAPILLIHGNPTSSYIWRDVLPPLEGLGRLIVPDLIGMGDSDKLPDVEPNTYRFTTHCDHLAAFIDEVIDVGEKVLLVGHDWGGALAFNWANRYPERVRGFAYMETIVRPILPTDESSDIAPIFMQLRSDQGEKLVLDQNMFVEKLLPKLVERELAEAEMAEYRRPFLKRQDRWPTLTWPREIPIAGQPPDVVAIAERYAAFMAENDLPKLFINAEPGAILTAERRDFCRSWKNQTEVTVPGRHFVQEDSGDVIGRAIARWIGDTAVAG